MRRLRKEEYLKKAENLESARTWRLESQWRVVDSHSAAVFFCFRPMVGLFYKAVPVLADEDKIGGSAITWLRTSDASTNKSQSRFYAHRLRVLRHTKHHMTGISPSSLFLAPNIVEPGPSAIKAGLPLGDVRGVTRPV